MRPEFQETIRAELRAIENQGLSRHLRRIGSVEGTTIEVDGQTLLNFSSNDYLGLASHPALKEAAIEAIERFGTGTGASRLVCGSLAPHHELEEALAAFKETEAALTFSSGYAAAVGSVCALCGKGDVLILDKLVHASLVDAGRLSGATLRVFAHNDLADLEEKLAWAGNISRTPKARVLLVTESVFSMDGDRAPLKQMVALKEKYGAWLMVDEAHATGVVGRSGRGLGDQEGVRGEVEIQMGTLGKALGAAGGFICGSRALVDLLVNRARSFIFSTAPPPGTAAAALAGLRLLQGPEGEHRIAALWANVRMAGEALLPRHCPAQSAILPIVIGDEARAVEVSGTLRNQGIFIPAIRYPAVARGKARLRLTLSAAHTQPEVTMVVRALKGLGS